MTNFEKLRKWRRVHKAGAIALIVLSVMGLAKMTTSPYHGGALLPSSVMGLIVGFVGLRIYRYSRCPHCGKSVMSPWFGRDGAGRNCIRRIEKRQPVLCVHCGEEVETQGIHSMFEDKKIRIVLKCVAVVLLLVLAVLTVTFNWSIWHDGIQGIVSGRFSSEYRFNVIYSGGAFDQGGLTKLVILIFAMELLAVICYALAVSISHSRWWRVVCIAMVLVFFVAPVGMNLLYSWELARYIAVMGITPKRIEGALLSILFLFVPMACLAGCFIGIKSTKRIIYAAFGCVLVAGIVFMIVNAISISCSLFWFS